MRQPLEGLDGIIRTVVITGLVLVPVMRPPGPHHRRREQFADCHRTG